MDDLTGGSFEFQHCGPILCYAYDVEGPFLEHACEAAFATAYRQRASQFVIDKRDIRIGAFLIVVVRAFVFVEGKAGVTACINE